MDNKKLIRNILVAVLIVVVLFGVLVLVNSIPDNSEENNYATESETPQIEVLKLDIENANSVKVENTDETFTVLKNGENYTVLGKEHLDYKNVNLGVFFNSFMDITANKDVTAENIPFEKTAQVTINMKDGTQHILVLGNEVIGESAYFLKYNNKTYVVPRFEINNFLGKSNNYRETHLVTIKPDINSVKIFENNKELVSFRQIDSDETDKFNYSVSFVMTYPKYLAVSEDKVRTFFEIFGNEYSVDAITIADDNMSNIGKYGIGKKTVIIDDGEKVTKLAFGNKDENGNIYAVVNDGNSIYTIPSTIYDEISSYNGDTIMSKLTHIYDLNNIVSITFEGKGDKFTLEQKGEKDNYSYFVNEEGIDEDNFKDAYLEIIGITSDKIAYDIASGSSEYIVTVNLPDGKTDKWEYISFNERNYVLTLNGDAKYICLKKNVENAMNNIKKLTNK